MLPADQSAASHKKYLYNSILVVCCHRNNVLVLFGAFRDLLLLRYGLYTVVKIPVPDSFLKIHFLTGAVHFFFQVIENRRIMPIQKLKRFFDLSVVFLLRHFSGTGGTALLHMIIQAGTLLADIPWQHLPAGTQIKKLI